MAKNTNTLTGLAMLALVVVLVRFVWKKGSAS